MNCQLDELIAAYLKAAKTGSTMSRQELFDQYPHLAFELREFFADYDHFESFAAPLRRINTSSPERERPSAG